MKVVSKTEQKSTEGNNNSHPCHIFVVEVCQVKSAFLGGNVRRERVLGVWVLSEAEWVRVA